MPGLESKGSVGIENVKVGAIDHTVPDEDGDYQEVTGVGFKPKVVIFFAAFVLQSPPVMSWGKDDGASRMCMMLRGDDVSDGSGGYSIYLAVDANNFAVANIDSMDDDGFTLHWSGSGTCIGMTGSAVYLAMR